MRVFTVFLILGLTLPGLAAADDDALSAAANQSFLAAGATKPGVVTRPDGLQYRILSSGFGKRPGLSDTVQIAYSGKLINGKVFDGATSALPATVAVSALIRGLNEALQMMHVGERWQLTVPSSLGFGPAGSPNGTIPPNQTLVFDVTLVAVLAAPPPGGAAPGVGFGVSTSAQGREEQGHAVLSFPQ